MYHPAMDLLDRPTAAPDRPGFGYSDALDEPPTIERYAAMTLEVADRLGWERFDVIGTHTGSVEAIEVARRAPGRVRHVGLVSIPAYTPDEIDLRLDGVAAPRPGPVVDGSHLVELWRRRASIRPVDVSPDHLQSLFVDEMLSIGDVHSAYRAVLEYPTLERLGDLVRPVVAFVPHDDLHLQTTRALPHLPAGSTVLDLPHLDFDLWSEAPAELVRLIDTHIPLERRSTSS
jgi:pimeloyl-ACP methyl ester carboxylesterase